MGRKRNFFNIFTNIRTKRRLSYQAEHEADSWYMFISPLEIISGFVALILIIFIIILTLAAYTNILSYIPGYKGNRSRETMIENIIRINSIEKRLDELQVYSSDIVTILEGKTPVIRNVDQIGDSITASKPEIVERIDLDSTLRAQMEGSGLYALNTPSVARKNIREGFELLTPVRGVVATHFNPKENRYGISIATAANQQVLAVEEGTVVLSIWTPEDGYLIQLQHADNLLSVYRRSSQSLVSLGSRVKVGEAIGSTGEGISGEEGKGFFEFELWHNGTAVDPESYIVF